MAVVSLNLSFASPLFYLLLGIFLTLYVLMILRKDQKKKILEFENNSLVKFYLNIFVQNKEEALSNVIKAKMNNKFIAGLYHPLLLPYPPHWSYCHYFPHLLPSLPYPPVP